MVEYFLLGYNFHKRVFQRYCCRFCIDIVVVVVHVVVVVKAEILLFLLLLLIPESYIESLIEIGSEKAEIWLTLCLCGWVVVSGGCAEEFSYVMLS